MQITRYPEGFTGAELRRQLGIPDSLPKKTLVKTKHQRAKKLNAFWSMWAKAHSREKKIAALVWAERQRFNLGGDMAARREFMRKSFDKHKHRLKPMDGNQRCRVCKEIATCRHHIITLNNGGRNHRRNLIFLCAECHALVHPWLKLKALPPEMAETMARVEREL